MTKLTRRSVILLAALAFVSTARAESPKAELGKVTPAGEKLAKFLDGTHVEQLWQSGQYVEWETGEASRKPIKGAGNKTHCSAFAAAVADRLGVYLLRPPEHEQELLANAQYEWLPAEGAKKGWRAVATPVEAQVLANKGELVLVVFRSPDPHKPGHIAVVRPAVKTVEQVNSEGPQISQAGQTNYVSTTVETGFKHHSGAWNDTEKTVRFYAHAIER